MLLGSIFEQQRRHLSGDSQTTGTSGDDRPGILLPESLLGDLGLLGYLHEHLQDPTDRRRRGAHYTSPELAREVVQATLAPLLSQIHTEEQLLQLLVCDPAMGAGAFLLEAGRILAKKLGQVVHPPPSEREAFRRVASACLRGIDLDSRAVWVARRSLWLAHQDPSLPLDLADRWLSEGDALAGDGFPVLDAPCIRAFVGNPPWVSYAGRAAQPLSAAKRADYARRFSSFHGYRNLQGLFVERCAKTLAAGGRLGLILPSSMAELSGYAPVRREHDQRCRCDDDLPDIREDAFAGVFQPSMALLSTRRASDDSTQGGAPWPLHRADLNDETRALLARFSGPSLPAHLFGERGLQTQRGDLRHLQNAPDEAHTAALGAGSDVRAFTLGPASYYTRPDAFGGRMTAGVWGEVKVLIRQTARFPMATRSDGRAFRNSILAGFEDEQFSADFLVAYLNSTPVRWLHYLRNRDARLGIPQVKIGHLRALPAPPAEHLPRIAELGKRLSQRSEPATAEEQERLDRAVASAFGLSERELALILKTPLAPGVNRADTAPTNAPVAQAPKKTGSPRNEREKSGSPAKAQKVRSPRHDPAAPPGSRRVDPGT